MVRPRSDWPEESKRYGLGFHLHATGDAVWLEGYDAGVSFASLAPALDGDHAHRHLELVGRRLAGRQAARRAGQRERGGAIRLMAQPRRISRSPSTVAIAATPKATTDVNRLACRNDAVITVSRLGSSCGSSA